MRRKLPQIIVAAVGLIMFLVYFSGHPTAQRVNQTILVDYWQIIFAFTLIVGVIGFARSNLQQIQRGDGRFFRIVSLVGLVSMPILALIGGINAGSPFVWMFDHVQAPMQATVFALLAFFVASAALRGFRARSVPAAILLLAATITLLARSDVGGATIAWLPETAEWIRAHPSMAARRAILIGIGLGSLTTSLRILIGIERTWLGSER